MNAVLDSLSTQLAGLTSARHIYVAYSGGLDSHVLLHGTTQVLGAERLRAIHINHQLAAQAGLWAEHCRAVCSELDVEFIGSVVEVPDGASRENAAREARYQVFEQLLGEDDVLLMAHHVDDQAETILYRLMRRSGPRGLAGMPRSRPLGKGRLLRPLLALEKTVLEAYARALKLNWVEDDSNRSQQFDRNFLRHEISPRLASRWPNYARRIADAGALCGEADQLNRDLAALDLEVLAMRRERLGWSMDIVPLVALSRIRQANVLRYLVMDRGFAPPGHRVIDEVLDHLLLSGVGRNPLVQWSGGQWRRFRQRLYLLPAEHTVVLPGDGGPVGRDVAWQPTEPLLLPDGAKLEAERDTGGGLKIDLPGNLRVGFRTGGERCRPAGRTGSASLKKLFQEYDLEPWLRARVPLIYLDDELVAVGDLWICEGFQASSGEKGWRLTWRYPVAGR